jgi:hypothetical protein
MFISKLFSIHLWLLTICFLISLTSYFQCSILIPLGNTWGRSLGTFEDINVNFGKQQCNFCYEYISVISLWASNLNTCYRPQIPHNSTLRVVYTQWPTWVGFPNYRPALGMYLLLNNDLFKKQWYPCVTIMRFLKTFSYQLGPSVKVQSWFFAAMWHVCNMSLILRWIWTSYWTCITSSAKLRRY